VHWQQEALTEVSLVVSLMSVSFVPVMTSFDVSAKTWSRLSARQIILADAETEVDIVLAKTLF
jgi:hypothetical protein